MTQVSSVQAQPEEGGGAPASSKPATWSHDDGIGPDLLRRPAVPAATMTEPVPGLDATARAERTLLVIFVAVRLIHLVQGGLTAAAGHYRHPLLNLFVLAAAVVESSWVFRRLVRQPVTDRAAGVVDVVFGATALLAVGLATTDVDRSAWVNWACPYAYGSLVLALMVFRRRVAAVVTVVFVAIYLATVHASLAAGGSLLATSAANTLTYVGIFVGAGLVVRLLRRSASETVSAAEQAVERGARLATQRERTRQYRMLHDSALQTLEAVSASLFGVDEALRRRVSAEASRLRHILRSSEEPPTSLRAALEVVTQDIARLGVRVELVTIGVPPPITSDRIGALCGATREALTNVVQHAGVRRAVVCVRRDDAGVDVVVRDQGQGYACQTMPAGFGQRQSIVERMGEVGGAAEIWSAPGRGTRVRLRVPA